MQPMVTQVRALRGATSVEENSAEAITRATHVLLNALMYQNGFTPLDVVSATFTVTPDLDTLNPATAARALGAIWEEVPLLCAQEPVIQGAPSRLVRVLLHLNTWRSPWDLYHVYVGEARALRPASHNVIHWIAPEPLAMTRRTTGAAIVLGEAAPP